MKNEDYLHSSPLHDLVSDINSLRALKDEGEEGDHSCNSEAQFRHWFTKKKPWKGLSSHYPHPTLLQLHYGVFIAQNFAGDKFKKIALGGKCRKPGSGVQSGGVGSVNHRKRGPSEDGDDEKDKNSVAPKKPRKESAENTTTSSNIQGSPSSSSNPSTNTARLVPTDSTSLPNHTAQSSSTTGNPPANTMRSGPTDFTFPPPNCTAQFSPSTSSGSGSGASSTGLPSSESIFSHPTDTSVESGLKDDEKFIVVVEQLATVSELSIITEQDESEEEEMDEKEDEEEDVDEDQKHLEDRVGWFHFIMDSTVRHYAVLKALELAEQ
ncbi:hypothetical protein BDP27DRAFT_20685 [Rhodocollybia butyracea]|uniref:Uncharacterized protein n=1 Tax=Rhodocollybia butyracea TaxID=206335 RepID=A0A9P5QBX9_9AGAR|nr:hypothetical protein BDP27DRAFT_20685 [Rhodocollybia butyracea]